MTTKKPALTPSLCRDLGTGDHPDSEVKGLYLRVTPAGGRSFTLRFRSADGRQRRQTLGKLSELSLAQARARARALLSGISRGEDLSSGKLRGEMTIQDLAKRYLEERPLKPASLSSYKSTLKVHILPLLGDQPLSSISRQEIRDFLKERSKVAKIQAAQAVRLLKAMIGWAIHDLEIMEGPNPCEKIKLATPKKRLRYLSTSERQTFWATLETLRETTRIYPLALTAIKLLALTGGRRREITGLRWSEVDLETGKIIKLDHKTSEHDQVRTIYLSEDATEILSKLSEKRTNITYVFPAKRTPGKPLDSMDQIWARILEVSKLEDFRLHDLRHSFASDGLSRGVSLQTIGALLGHRSTQTTARYAHLADDAARRALEEIADEMKRPSNVIPMKKKKTS